MALLTFLGSQKIQSTERVKKCTPTSTWARGENKLQPTFDISRRPAGRGGLQLRVRELGEPKLHLDRALEPREDRVRRPLQGAGQDVSVSIL